VSLAPPETVRKLQETLHAKAKGASGSRFSAVYDKVYRRDVPEFAFSRFSAVYDKVYRRDVPEFAFDRCRSHDGAPGIDGQTFAGIEAYGVACWLDELAEDPRTKTYHPQPVRRVSMIRRPVEVASQGCSRVPSVFPVT
jgi:RNA-directed DNA polymerase